MRREIRTVAGTGLLALAACAHARVTPSDFAGSWSLVDKCVVYQHFINLDIKETANGINGAWSDGTLVHGSDGHLTGSLQGSSLHVKLCSDDPASGLSKCPYNGIAQAVFERRGDDLVWYDVLEDGRLIEYAKLLREGAAPKDETWCTADKDAEGAV